MAPLDSRASTAFWRSWQLFLVWNTMLWWVSWGQCWKFRPTPSSTASCQRRPAAEAWVAPEDLRRWYTLGHRWPPWTDSARKDCVSCVMVLWMVGWLVNPRRLNTEVLACCVLTFGVFLVTWDVVSSLVVFWKVTEDPDILSACLMLCSRCCSTFGSGPTTCDPSNGPVCTTLRTCGWKLKFFSRASLLSSCRLVTWSSHPWGLVHLFIVFKPLCYPGCRRHRVQ